MNQAIILLSLLLLMTSCSFKDIDVSTQNQDIISTVEPTYEVVDRVEDDYWIEEIPLPKELDVESPLEFLSFTHINESLYRVYVMDKRISMISPTVAVYDFNIETNELKEVEFKESGKHRVWHSIFDDKGKCYEVRSYFEESNQFVQLFYEGKPIEKTKLIFGSPYNRRGFHPLNGSIYFLGETQLNYNQLAWIFFELKDGQAEIVEQIISERGWGFDKWEDESDNWKVDLPPIQVGTKNQLAITLRKNDSSLIRLFDGKTFLDYPVDGVIRNIISLKDALLFSRMDEQEDGSYIENIYFYDKDKQKSMLIGPMNTGRALQTNDNEFYNLVGTSLPICKVEDNKLICREIEEFIKENGDTVAYPTEDKDLVCFNFYGEEKYRLYLIHWN